MRIIGACAIVISLVAFPSDARSPAIEAAGSAATIRVAFLQGEQLAEVRRPGATPLAAVRALIAGPTSAERSRGYRTYLGDRHTASPTERQRLARDGRSQQRLRRRAARTPDRAPRAARAHPHRARRDHARSGSHQRRSAARPDRRDLIRRPGHPPDAPDAEHPGAGSPATQAPGAGPRDERPPKPADRTRLPAARRRRRSLRPGDLRRAPDVPEMGAAVSDRHARHTNKATACDRSPSDAQLTRPREASGDPARSAGRAPDQGRHCRARISVSTGKPSTPTPPGNYSVYAKIPRWWSTPFREWLPWAIPFVGGIALHQYEVVPTYAASHDAYGNGRPSHAGRTASRMSACP
jgi:hypothetical protein